MTLPLLVFSDLDGTLLDHHSYDWTPARPAIDQVLALGGGIVLATSKTAAEVVVLRAEMGLADWPAIVENGAGILPPGHDLTDTSGDYDRLRAALETLPAHLRSPYRGFGDMSIDEVAQATGLPPEGAARAKIRLFSEPGTWRGSEAAAQDFVAALATVGVSARMGGRFLTLSFGRTKADAMADLITQFSPRHTIALGDAPNDVEMIEAAERGIVIPNPDASPLPHLRGEDTGDIRRAAKPGPFGWNLAVSQAIEDWNLSTRDEAHG